MATKVRIERLGKDWSDDYTERAETRIYVDGKYVGGGAYGGEPEDNTRGRDYRWVDPTLQALAAALGAEVEVTSQPSEPERE